jgi:hypothetical protein
MSSESRTLHSPLSRPEPLSRKNSPVAYGLGTLGLSTIGHAFGGYYMFYYVDVLGLAAIVLAIAVVVAMVWYIARRARRRKASQISS